jgi:lipoprotein-releasing system permease protein
MILAVGLCVAQQQFGLIRLGQSEGSFIVNVYPVVLEATDLLIILLTILFVGGVSVAWATRRR